MAAFFISHSSADNEIVARIRDRLISAGFQSLFLDFDVEQGIPPGRRWEDELYVELRKADVVVFVGTRAALGSKWCHAELALAKALRKEIVPLLLDSDARHPLVADRQWIAVSGDVDDAFERLASVLRDRGIGPLDTLDWDRRIGPYPGLVPFDERRAGVFFGRDAEIGSISDLLAQPQATGLQRLVLVVGASGTGKSSIVRAGVLPRLTRSERFFVLPAFTPDDVPLEKLARSFASAWRGLGHELAWQSFRDRIAAGAEALVEAARDVLDAAGRGSGGAVVLAVDQAEQLVTQCTRADRIAFVDILVGALEGPAPLCVVATLRPEYLADLAAATALEGGAASTVSVGRMSAPSLAQVIEAPAGRAGIEFEDGLVQRMVEETRAGAAAGGDPLPLLAFTLRQLYEHRTDPSRMTRLDYERVGGVVGALTAEAGRVHEQLKARGLGDAVVPALLELVHAEAERDPTGRSVRRERFDEARGEVVDAFVEARLLTSEGDDPVVTVAHEALLGEWPVLTHAIEESRDDLQARARLERDAREWAQGNRDPSYLIGGLRLEAARLTLGKEPEGEAAVGELEQEFFRASVAAEESSRAAAMRLRKLVTRVLVAALVLVSAGAILALWQSRVAADERDTARSRELTASGQSQLDVDPVRALLLGIEAAEARRTPEAETLLREGLIRLKRFIVLPERSVTAASFSPYGKRVVTAGRGVKIWNAETGNQTQTLAAFGQFDEPSFSPDGNRVFALAFDDTVRVWQLPSGRMTAIPAPGDRLWSARLCADGRRVATIHGHEAPPSGLGFTWTVRVWSAVDGRQLAARRVGDTPGTGQPVIGGASVGISPDCRFVVTAAYTDGSAYIWDMRTGLAIANAFLAADHGAEFVADGAAVLGAGSLWRWRDNPHPGPLGEGIDGVATGEELLAAPSTTAKYAVWKTANGAEASDITSGSSVLLPHSQPVDDADVGGTVVATHSPGATVSLWQAQTGALLGRLTVHHDGVRAFDVSDDDERVVTVDGAGRARIWALVTAPPPRVLTKASPSEAEWFAEADFSPDRRLLVTAGTDSIARVWDVRTGRKLLELDSPKVGGHEHSVAKAVFSPDGRRIVTAGRDNVARIWDTATGARLLTLPDRHEADEHALASVAFSPDGGRVATVADDGRAALWDARTGRRIARLAGDGLVAFGTDPEVLITTRAGRPLLWDPRSGESGGAIGRGGEDVGEVAVAPDGRFVAIVRGDITESELEIWSTDSRRLVVHVGLSEGIYSVEAIEFAPDGNQIAVLGEGGSVAVWRVPSGELVARFGFSREVGLDARDAISFSSDGRFLAAAAPGVAVWEVETARAWVELPERFDPYIVRFGPDGRTLLLVDEFDEARLYDCEVCRPFDELVALARARAQRALTPQERRQFLHEE